MNELKWFVYITIYISWLQKQMSKDEGLVGHTIHIKGKGPRNTKREWLESEKNQKWPQCGILSIKMEIVLEALLWGFRVEGWFNQYIY